MNADNYYDADADADVDNEDYSLLSFLPNYQKFKKDSLEIVEVSVSSIFKFLSHP